VAQRRGPWQATIARHCRLVTTANGLPKTATAADRSFMPLSQHSLRKRRYAACRHVGAVEFGDETAVARDADAASQVGLQIDVWRWRDECRHLAAVVHQRELRSARPLRYHGPKDAHGIIAACVCWRTGCGASQRRHRLPRRRNIRRALLIAAREHRELIDLRHCGLYRVAVGLRLSLGEKLLAVSLQPLGIPKLRRRRGHAR